MRPKGVVVTPWKIAVICLPIFLVSCDSRQIEVATDAMAPVMKIGDRCEVEPIGDSGINRFDIVLHKIPESENEAALTKGATLAHRVIGMPNEVIEIKANEVFVNGAAIDPEFDVRVSETDLKLDFGPVKLPPESFFLLGDNRPRSLDSRYYENPGVRRENIVGRIGSCTKSDNGQ
ncbi:MAG: signal peptidase I [Acidobacteriota bacterium]|nr:MAG: signal peptidase I [Acidobacteriota bacterium]